MALLTFWAEEFLLGKGCSPVPWRILSLYSVDVCSILPVMTTTTKTSPGEENHHSQKALQGRPGWEAISQEEIKAALDCRNGGKKMDLREM